MIGNNSAKIIQGRDSIGSEYVYTTHGDGVYKDGSLVQHNNIAYTGGYGSVWLKGTADMSYLLTDSPWPITDPNVLNIYEWVAQTYEPVIYNGQFMDSTSGRYFFNCPEFATTSAFRSGGNGGAAATKRRFVERSLGSNCL